MGKWVTILEKNSEFKELSTTPGIQYISLIQCFYWSETSCQQAQQDFPRLNLCAGWFYTQSLPNGDNGPSSFSWCLDSFFLFSYSWILSHSPNKVKNYALIKSQFNSSLSPLYRTHLYLLATSTVFLNSIRLTAMENSSIFKLLFTKGQIFLQLIFRKLNFPL